jgi:hypothetical protein
MSLMLGSKMAVRLSVAALFAFGFGGCGGQTTVVKTVTVSSPGTATHAAQKKNSAVAPRASAKLVRASAKKAKRTVAHGFVQCDANIQARVPTTSCGFAQNAFYEYWTSSQSASISVYSPATGRVYLTACTPGEGWVVCTTNDGGAVKFPQASIDSYSQSQADAYAAAHTTGSDSSSAGTNGGSSPDSSSSPAVPDSTNAGADPNFCDTHDCIPNYPNGNGSTVQCSDGSYSQSGGIQGACSHHGGVG